jgi:peptidyl-dipeptidase Dcp
MTIIATDSPAATRTPHPVYGAAGPLSRPSPLPFEAPPFDRLSDDGFVPAIEAAMKKQLAEVKAIADNPARATFENTIVALERSGVDLTRANRIFGNLTSSNTNDRLQEAKAALAPKLAAHGDAINLDPKLFARVKAVHDRRDALDLDAVSKRLLERYYTQFVRSGALLDRAGKSQLRKLNEEEANLTTSFTDHILKEVTASAIVVDRREQLDGLPDDQITAAAEAAKARGLDGKWLIALQNHTGQSILALLKDRALRERIFEASIARNASGPNDTRPIITRLAQLRAEKARLFGYPTWADYVMDDQMARTPAAAAKLLGDMAPAAARNARAEAAKMQALIDRQNGGFQLQAWDWDFYAEQVRLAEYDLDESSLKPYFELERVLRDGVFFAAHEMYGLDFRERHDLPVYQPDVRVFEVSGDDGVAFGLMYVDDYAHDGKNGGAWMSTFVDQSTLLDQHPVIINNLNVVKPAAGQPALLDFDEVTTMFHEFGHALHGLLSRQKYPYFSGANVTTDFVEFPSQFNENWALEPRVLANYAKHYQTGAPMPQELVDRIVKSRKFNQGYGSTEYLAAALLDIAWHSLPADAPRVTDVEAFEKAALAKYGLDLPQVPPRYKSPYFSHIWDNGYSANYYAYMWADVLAVDGYQWFVEHGGMTRANGMHFRDTVLSQGGSKDPAALYRDFRGRDPDVGPLLDRRGLN